MNVGTFSTLRQFHLHHKAIKLRKLVRDLSTEIQIPARIDRGPTDILKAISATVGTDYTAPDYRYIDDPWLTPFTQNEKREFTIARESGREAARFILENHPSLFEKNRIEAEPPITAFLPRAKYNQSNVTIELLENMILNHQVTDAVNVYELLVEKRKNVPDNLKQSLLESLAFYSEDEPLTVDTIASKQMLPNIKSWATGGLAEKLYSELSDSAARLAMLIGLARHNQPTRAIQMWNEMEANNDPIPVEGFNAYLVTITTDDVSKLKEELTTTLSKMRALNVSPDANTLVSCLEGLVKTGNKHKGNYAACCELALSLLAEFKVANVNPSLGTYYQIMEVFYCRHPGQRDRHLILKDIMDLVEDRDWWPAQSQKDFDFFARAMEVSHFLINKQLAYRVHQMFLSGRNCNLIGSQVNTEKYYWNFLLLVLRTEDLDTFMELYNKTTPHTWSPRREVFNDVLTQISIKSAVHHLGKIFDDMELCSYGGTGKEDIYIMNTTVLKCMDSNPSATSQYTNLGPTYVDISKRIFKHLEENKASDALYLRFNIHAAGICTLAIKILLKEGQFDEAVKVLEFCMTEKARMPGQLSDEVLELLHEAAVAENNPDVALQVVDYLISMNCPKDKARRCGEKLAVLPLSDNQKQILNKLFSYDPKWTNL